MQFFSFSCATLVFFFQIFGTLGATVADKHVLNKEDHKKWSDIAVDALKILGEAAEKLQSNTDAQVLNDTEIILKTQMRSINGTLQQLETNSEKSTWLIQELQTKASDTDEKISSDIRPMMANLRSDVNAYSENLNKYHSEVIGMRSSVEKKIEGLKDSMDISFSTVDKRLLHMDQRFDEIDRNFNQVGQNFVQVGQNFVQVGQNFTRIDQTLTGINKRLDELHKLVESIIHPTTPPKTNNIRN